MHLAGTVDFKEGTQPILWKDTCLVQEEYSLLMWGSCMHAWKTKIKHVLCTWNDRYHACMHVCANRLEFQKAAAAKPTFFEFASSHCLQHCKSRCEKKATIGSHAVHACIVWTVDQARCSLMAFASSVYIEIWTSCVARARSAAIAWRPSRIASLRSSQHACRVSIFKLQACTGHACMHVHARSFWSLILFLQGR